MTTVEKLYAMRDTIQEIEAELTVINDPDLLVSPDFHKVMEELTSTSMRMSWLINDVKLRKEKNEKKQ